jgi:hypothetical protein
MLATAGTPATAGSQQQQDTNNSGTSSKKDVKSNSRAYSKKETPGT